jgi:hypothetical protein
MKKKLLSAAYKKWRISETNHKTNNGSKTMG